MEETVLSFKNLCLIALLLTVFSAGLIPHKRAFAQGDVVADTDFRKIKNPNAHGTTLIDRNSRDSKTVKPVLFPHWAHRSKYNCKVCHTDLGFALKSGGTDIKQADIEAGKYCGKCHAGVASFGVNECNRCHSYGIEVKENRRIEDALKDLPKDPFGNRINWIKALRDGLIKPAASLDGKSGMKDVDDPFTFTFYIDFPVNKFTPHPPDVRFPHKAHAEQLECSSCHPAIFKDKKGGNPEMNMLKIISGQYCGTCHGKISFPLDDCFRCHSQPLPEKKEDQKDDKTVDKDKKEDKKDDKKK